MEGLDPVGGEAQRIGQFGRDGGDCFVRLGFGDPEAVGGQGHAIEAGGQFDQGVVAACADLAEDVRDHLIDPGRRSPAPWRAAR